MDETEPLPGSRAPSDDAELVHIGPYRLIRVLGEGGMGRVYLAEQIAPIQRRVAIKVIKAGGEAQEVIARFEAERQALALMNHPSIAQIYDAGTTDSGRPFFVMEFIEGEPITAYCDRLCLDTERRLRLLVQVCDAVQHAHQKGVIHRDLKPSNILVTESGDAALPKIIDFGLAKANARRLTDRTFATEFGQILGTPLYMSPEQTGFADLDVDTRSDVYALGVIAYELLTGTLPITAEELRSRSIEEALRILREAEPPRPSDRLTSLGGDSAKVARSRGTDARRLVRALRGDLDWIVMKSIEKDRRRRYDSAAELGRDVERVLRREPIVAGPPTLGYRLVKFVNRHRAAAGAVAAAALVSAVGFAVSLGFFVRAQRAAEEATRERNQARYSGYVANLGAATAALDGGNRLEAERRLDACPAELRGWEWRHLVRRCDTSLALVRVHHGRPIVAVVDPDGTRLRVAQTKGPILVWNLVGGSPSGEPASVEAPEQIAAFDGRYLVAREGDELSLFEVEPRRKIGSMNAPRDTRFFELAVRISGGETRWVAAAGKNVLRLWTVGTGRAVSVPCSNGLGSSRGVFAFDREGRRVVYVPAPGQVAILDLNTLRATTIRRDYFGSWSFAFSPDGKTLATGESDGTIRFRDLASGREFTRRDGSSRVVDLAFSPDGSMLATVSDDRFLRVWDGRTVSLRGRHLGHTDAVETVAFDSTGTRIVTTSEDGTVGVWDPRAGFAEETTGVMDQPEGDLVWSEKRLLASSKTMPIGREDVVDVTNGGVVVAKIQDHIELLRGVRLSADGRRAVYWGKDGAGIVDLVSGRDVGIPLGAGLGVNSVTISAVGDRVVTCDSEGTLRVHDATTGVVLAAKSLHDPDWSVSLAIDSKDRYVVSSSSHRVVVSDLRDLGEVFRVEAKSAGFGKCAFDGVADRVACSIREPCAVRVWTVPEGALVRDFVGHSADATALAWTPDGSRVAAGTRDGRVRIWDASTAETLLELSGVPSRTRAVALAFDGEGENLACKFSTMNVTWWKGGRGRGGSAPTHPR